MSEPQIQGNVPAEVAAAVAELSKRQQSLEQIMFWAVAQTPSLPVSDVIQQDEFSFDVILPYEGYFLVYDVT